MPVKMRKTGARAASSTNIAAKMGITGLTAAQGQNLDKEGDKFGKRRSTSSHALAQHQPRPFSRTGSQNKLFNNRSNGKHPAQHHDSPAVDDEDWVSSSSAVASPAPEPNDEEEEDAIYVNPNIHGRTAHHESPTATPRRSNQLLPHHQRHHPNPAIAEIRNNEQNAGVVHPNPTVGQRHQNQLPTESNHIRFVGEPGRVVEHHILDERIHHHGVAHHVSPPPPAQMPTEEATLDQPSSSVVRITGPLVPEQTKKPEPELILNGDRRAQSHQRDERSNPTGANAKQHQDQIDTYARQIATTSAPRPAVAGNADVDTHVGQGDNGKVKTQRGFGAALTPLTQAQEVTPSAPLDPSIVNESVSRSATAPRPSMLRRDTTPVTVSHSPVAVHNPPRSQTPPASMTHDEMVANNNKRSSIHSTGAQRRPMSLFQPSLQAKRHSITSRPLSQHNPGHPAPLSLLARLNTLQGGNVTAAPAVSPTHENEDESAYASMSPTRSRAGHTLRRRGSVASINSVATAPVISTSSATAQGATASPTTQATTSSSILHNLTAKPTKHLSMTSRSDVRPDLRRSELRMDDNPLFVSQFCHTKAYGSKGPERSLGEEMAGEEEWESHLSITRYHNLMRDSIGRVTAARSSRSK